MQVPGGGREEPGGDAAGIRPAAPPRGSAALRARSAPETRVGRCPGGAQSKRSRHGPGDYGTRRLGEPEGFPLRPSDPRLAQASSLLPGPAAEEEDPRGRCWGGRHLPPKTPSRSGVGEIPTSEPCHESGRRAGAAVFVFISIAAPSVPLLRPDPPPPPLLFLLLGHLPSFPTPICYCQMRKSPRRTQTLQPPRAPSGTWQHAAAGSSAQQLGGVFATQLSELLCI